MSDDRKMVTFTIPKLKALKAAYDLALKNDQTEFVLDDDVYLVGYAKYLIEYLEGKLK